MKNFSVFIMIFFGIFENLFSQNIGIGTNIAILDITSKNKEVLVSRMTTANRLAIISPADVIKEYTLLLKN